MMLSCIGKELMEEHAGSEGMEAVIVSPLMFGTFFMLMYFFFMALTFISYNNVANSIAQDLNMRQKGFQSAMASYQTFPRILSYRVSADGPIPASSYLDPSDVVVNPETPELKAGAYFAIDKHKDQFIIPFSEITSIEVETARPVDSSMGKGMAGNVVMVKINYKTMGIGRSGRGLINMSAVGYNVIA